ncbi:MAG: hypothetical protein OEW64_01425 [Gammaproteobacteria bacterium]|nr:hypothetical protein [Gammaproteobacteria bacterium]MDH5302741.1 hypothetical protein [Gammaproteobacteria bacterium]MDH5321327.1 hypothetical protein [Gammaproteobacteria bacterium]
MIYINKSTMALTALALFGLTLACTADAATQRGQRHTSKPIAACVAEIGRHADYSDAMWVVHTIYDLDQVSLVELKIRIETNVYLQPDRSVSRVYAVSCVTDTLGAVVDFRLDAGPEQSN